MSENSSAPVSSNGDVALRYPGGELPLPLRPATEGPDGIDTSKLLATTGSRTASSVYPMTPKSTSARLSMLASTGRRMERSDNFIARPCDQ